MRGISIERPLLVVSLTAVTALVAFVQLAAGLAPLYGYDEAWHLYLSTVSPLSKALEEMAVDPHPPLYYLLLRPLFMLGPEPFWGRLPAVIASILTVPLWYLVLRKLDLARAVALTLTLVLAVSQGFNELGPTVRAYSIAALCLVAALWYWCDFMAVARAKPSRGALAAMLALLTAAFWCSYYAVFFSLALVAASLLASLFDRRLRNGLAVAWQAHLRWPELTAVVLVHALGVAWFLVGYGRAGLAAPPHVSPHLYDSDAMTVGGFLLHGLRGYGETFTPLSGVGDPVLYLGLIVIALGWLSVLVVSLHRGAMAHAALLATIPLVLAILFVAGLVGFYPFGGYLRHQHLLSFFLLLALGIGLDLVYRRLPGTWPRLALCVLVVAGAVASAGLARRDDPVGEAPTTRPLAAALDTAFGDGSDPVPVYMAVYPFYIVYADRFGPGIDYLRSYGHTTDGWVDISQVPGGLARLGVRREWDKYRVVTDAGSSNTVLRDRRQFRFPAVPDDDLLARLRELMVELGLERLRILRADGDGVGLVESRELAAAFEAEGFGLRDLQTGPQGATWVIERH